jgi:hypothetical protein
MNRTRCFSLALSLLLCGPTAAESRQDGGGLPPARQKPNIVLILASTISRINFFPRPPVFAMADLCTGDLADAVINGVSELMHDPTAAAIITRHERSIK